MARPRKRATKPEEIIENIEEVEFSEQFRGDFVDYGLYVIGDRAIPDVRDGLKPSQRRIIYGLGQMGAKSTSNHVKSARATGDIMGKYHPHGDGALYQVAVNMARPWKTNLVLTDIHGNKGNIQGSGAAAQRYTSIRLSWLGDRFISRLRRGVVPFVPNYSNDLVEPTVLPIDLPYLLIAGSTGILTVAVNGEIPPHNPREVMEAVIAYIKNPRISDQKLFELLPGPDFPTGGTLLNADAGIEFYKTGKFAFQIRGGHSIEGRKMIIDEIPFTESGKVKALQTGIVDMVYDKKLQTVKNAVNYSNKAGIRIEVEPLKADTDLDTMVREIYVKTGLQTNYHATFNALRGGVPHTFSLREYLSDYVDFQYEVLENETRVLLTDVLKLIELQTGLRTALDDIKVIVELIQNAKSTKDIDNCLSAGVIPAGVFSTKANERAASKFRFTELQIDAILNTRLRKLSSLDKVAIESTLAKAQKEKAHLEKILSDPAEAKKELLKRQREVAKLFAGPEWDRKTVLTNEPLITYKQEVKVVDYEAFIDRFGYLKVTLAGSVKDSVDQPIKVKSDQKLTFWDSTGAAHNLSMAKIKVSGAKDKGDNIAGLAKIGVNDWALVNSATLLDPDGEYLFVTEQGQVKRVDGNEFTSKNSRLAGPKLKAGNKMIHAQRVGDSTHLILVTNLGRVKRVKISEISKQSRTAAGVSSGKLLEGESVIKAFLGDDKSKFEVDDQSHTFKSVTVSKLSTAFKKLD